MRYSNLFTKTKREIPTDEVSLNAQLLVRAGYIQKEMAGVYAFLPLGKLVVDKIVSIVRDEMNSIGGQEVLLGSLQNPEVWQISNRWDDEVLDVWFKTKLKNGSEVGLATTHEEPLTKIMTRYIDSYKDLPQYVFQFQNKFRNEPRAKSGILRTREFLMKDLYSFNRSLEEQAEFYEEAKKAYFRIFQRLGLLDKTFLTFASGGAFSKYSEEFQTICDAGEDLIYLDKNRKLALNKEVLNEEVLQDLGLKREDLHEYRAIEVGNVFKLGTKYSESLGLFFMDETGQKKPVIMGSYGIGIYRSMGTIVEVLSDEFGIVWPREVAPFTAHLVGINLEDGDVKNQAEKTYEILNSFGVETIFDDREDVSAGEKLQDADLLGMPFRLIVSGKTKEGLEFKPRTSSDATVISVEEAISLMR